MDYYLDAFMDRLDAEWAEYVAQYDGADLQDDPGALDVADVYDDQNDDMVTF